MTSIRLTLRALLRRPGFTAAAVGTIALAIGLNSAVFGFIDGVLSPLPYGEPERLVNLNPVGSRGGLYGLASLREVADFAEARSLSGLAAVEETTVAIAESADRLEAAYVTPNLFDVLAVAPARGRAFVAADIDEAVVLISDLLWRDAFDRDPAAVGATVRVGGRDRTVVGVMPPGIGYPMVARLWLPFDRLRFDAARDVRHVSAIGRLADGADAREASAELNAIAERMAELYPETNEGYSVMLRYVADDIANEMRPVAVLLFGAASFVLLIACANVASLMLARAAARRREIAIRFALGASRRQVAAQLLLESAALGAAGGALGLILAVWGRDIIVAMLPVDVPAWMTFGLGGSAIAFTAGATLAAVLLVGLAPAIIASRGTLAQHGRSGDDDPGRARGRRTLVVAETALAFMLLIGAGLLLRSAMNVQRADLGYEPRGVMTALVGPAPQGAMSQDGTPHAAADVVARLAALQGVSGAAFSAALPRERVAGTGAETHGGPVTGDGGAGASARYIGYNTISSDFFRVLELPVIAGRPIDERDAAGGAPVVVLSQTAARRLWPDDAPVGVIGRQLRIGDADASTHWHTVIGVAADRHNAGFGAGGPAALPRAELYFAAAQGSSPVFTLYFRTAADVAGHAAIEGARLELAQLAPALDAQRLRPLEEVVRQQAGTIGWMARILGAFATAAIGLAMLGLYGVLAWSVARRTREIGVRMALGASTAVVRRMIALDGLRLVAFGALIGALGGAGLSRLLSSLLFGLDGLDPLTFAAGTALLLGTAAAAAWLPARRASRVEPLVALKQEI